MIVNFHFGCTVFTAGGVGCSFTCCWLLFRFFAACFRLFWGFLGAFRNLFIVRRRCVSGCCMVPAPSWKLKASRKTVIFSHKKILDKSSNFFSKMRRRPQKVLNLAPANHTSNWSRLTGLCLKWANSWNVSCSIEELLQYDMLFWLRLVGWGPWIPGGKSSWKSLNFVGQYLQEPCWCLRWT